MFKPSFLVAIAATLAACGRGPTHTPSTVASIVGGATVTPASPVARGVVGVVGTDGFSKFLCTGVLISEDAVLTAGHCGDHMMKGEIVFSTDLSSIAPRAVVTAVSVQPKFSIGAAKNSGDLAVLRFKTPPPIGYRPAQVALADMSAGQPLVLAGFGLLDGQLGTAAKSLHAVQVIVTNPNYSKTEFTVTPGACHGDSGGPALITSGTQLYVVGITSRGFDDICTKDAIYTKVSAYQDWIRNAAK